MSSFIVISFYTLDTPYEDEARGCLIPSLDKLHIPHHIVGVPNRGVWRLNIYEKGPIISSAMDRFRYKNIVFLDADAEVCRELTLFEDGCDGADFAYHHRGQNLSSGTMFFRNKYAARRLVEHWCVKLHLNEVDGSWQDQTEQEALKAIIPAHRGLVVKDIPLSYSTIFDGPQPEEPVVIRHHQASRRYKDGVAL